MIGDRLFATALTGYERESPAALIRANLSVFSPVQICSALPRELLNVRGAAR